MVPRLKTLFQRARASTLVRVIGAALLIGLSAFAFQWLTYPSDKTPEGAYLRVVRAVTLGRANEFFAYTEEEAQHACYSIRDYRKKSLERARRAYPPEALQQLEQEIAPFAAAPDGADVFQLYAEKEGWLGQLRADLSGVDKIETRGERASVQTVQGTRYAFRRRPGGIWGLTAFTPLLVEEAARAARDHALIERAAQDYARAASLR